MPALGFFFLVAAVALAAYGWGRPVVRWAYGDVHPYPAFSVAVGVSLLTALGGLLNLFHIAYAPLLGATLLAGFVFAIATIRRHRVERSGAPDSLDRGEWVVRVALLALAVFFAATLIPSQAFNFHDDFHTYFARPLRMLVTGSLGGDEFELLGVDSLGAQSYWHGVFIFAADPSWLNGFDAVFSFLLAGFLLIDLRRRLEASSAYLIAAALVYVAINPQTVNISALFSGVAIMLGIAFAAVQLGSGGARRALPLGLLLATLAALKTTFIAFAGVFVVVYFCLWLWRDGTQALKTAAGTAVIASLALLPWLAIHARHYFDTLESLPVNEGAAAPGLLKGWLALLSTDPLVYGGRAVYYGAVIALLGVGLAVTLRAYRPHGDKPADPLFVTVAAMCAGALGMFSATLGVMDPLTALRYACPALIAVLPLLLLSVSRLPGAPFAVGGIGAGVWASGAIAVLVGGMFADTLGGRIARAYMSHTTASFPVSPQYLRYNNLALGDAGRLRTRLAQEQVPAGKPLLAWVSTPFQLDFARNSVFIASEPGWMNRWLDLPIGAAPETLRAYFLARGVRHLLWEHTGGGMPDSQRYSNFSASPFPIYRRLAQVNRYMQDAWQKLAQSSQLLYDAHGIAVIDLASPISAPVQGSVDDKS
jgi:hypothetical protein